MKAGDLLIYPTESSYALGCIFNDRAGIKKIMQLKGRSDPRFTVVASSVEQIQKYFKLSPAMLALGKQYWPGALSIVVGKRYAVRVPGLASARQAAELAGAPLIATSLNVSGEPPVFDLKQLPVRFHGISIIDGGVLQPKAPSTVVECFRGGYVVHRLGAVNIQ